MQKADFDKWYQRFISKRPDSPELAEAKWRAARAARRIGEPSPEEAESFRTKLAEARLGRSMTSEPV